MTMSISERELRFRFSRKQAFRRREPIPVNASTMWAEWTEATKENELVWIEKPETPRLFCRCFDPSCRADHIDKEDLGDDADEQCHHGVGFDEYCDECADESKQEDEDYATRDHGDSVYPR